MDLGRSIYQNQANTTANWCTSDTEMRWNKNISNSSSKKLLDNLGWTEDSISYTFNSSGFRSDEFDDTGNGIIFLGCSFTVGIGISLHKMWTHKIATHFGLKHWNLGQGSGANDTCYRLGAHWIPKLKPKMVIMLSPSRFRMEIIHPESIQVFLPNIKQSTKYDFYTNWLSDDGNSDLNIRKNVDALHLLCYQLDIPFYNMTVEDSMFSCGAGKNDLARDLMHSGCIWNNNVANKFLEMIEERG